jgi:hypothetical protein
MADKFEFKTLGGERFVGTREEAHAKLRQFAESRGFAVDEHAGTFAGYAASTAYDRGGDPLYDIRASVVIVREAK